MAAYLPTREEIEKSDATTPPYRCSFCDVRPGRSERSSVDGSVSNDGPDHGRSESSDCPNRRYEGPGCNSGTVRIEGAGCSQVQKVENNDV